MDARDVGLEFASRWSATRQGGSFCIGDAWLPRPRCSASRALQRGRFRSPGAAGILPMALLQLAHNPKSIGGISDVGVISEAGG
jgi:hypothetical protein